MSFNLLSILGSLTIAVAILLGLSQRAQANEVPSASSPSASSPTAQPPAPFIQVASSFSVAETSDRVETLLADRGLTQFARIDHAAGAASVELELRPTTVILFGNPRVGTPLMQCDQTVGIDLPLKVLIWEDAAGQVWLGYQAPANLQSRYDLADCSAVIERMTTALQNLANAATRPQ